MIRAMKDREILGNALKGIMILQRILSLATRRLVTGDQQEATALPVTSLGVVRLIPVAAVARSCPVRRGGKTQCYSNLRIIFTWSITLVFDASFDTRYTFTSCLRVTRSEVCNSYNSGLK